MSERVLVVAAHPDDEALGCGGTIARHSADGDDVHVVFVADGETSRGMKALPNRNFMAHEAAKVLDTRSMLFLDFSDQRLDQVALLDIIKLIEVQAFIVKPTIVYTHHAGDLNLDHRIVHQAVMTAFRPLPGNQVKAIYAFEVLSSTEWGTGFVPNHFVDISNFVGKKIDALRCYDSEMRKAPHARTYQTSLLLADLRGASAGLYSAEAFMTLRSIVR